MPDMMDSEDTMQGETGMDMDKPSMGEPDSDEGPTVFLPKAITMGKTFKEGDEIVLKITDVDPETGDLAAIYAPEKGGEEGGMMDEFDKAMPEEKGY